MFGTINVFETIPNKHCGYRIQVRRARVSLTARETALR